jgi:hypothetical protein
MQMTGWISGQVFMQTVDDAEVEQATAYLNAKGISFQVLTASERITMDETDPASAVTANSYSIAIQLGGFPQVLGPVITEITQRVHGGGWVIEPEST